MKHDTFFHVHPVFAGDELAKHLSSLGEFGKRAQESLLSYHLKTGRIVRVRRSLYAVIPAGADATTYPVDPFLVAAKLTADAVLSHHTALEFHGRAYSPHRHFIYSASRPLATVAFRSYVFTGTRFQQALSKAGKEQIGVDTAERAGLDLRVTTFERTLVDVLDRPDLSGSWEEIWRSLESIEFFNLSQVLEYALLLGNATTIAKVGFFLEQHRQQLMVDDQTLEALLNHRPRQPHYLDRAKRKDGRLIPQWNLVVPKEVLERSWGAVL